MPTASKPDDPTVTRALWWAISALVLAVVATLFFLLKGTGPTHSALSPSASPSNVPLAIFTDVTSASGIHFRHYNGAHGDKLLPETMGGGVAFLDFNGDGQQDLLFVN